MADPRIYGQYANPLRSVADYVGEWERVKLAEQTGANLRQENAIKAMAINQQERDRMAQEADANAFARLVTSAQGDRARLINNLRFSGRPGLMKQADAMEKSAADTMKAQADAAKSGADAEESMLKVRAGQLNTILQAASSAVDQPSYTAALQRLSASGFDVSSLPAQFDPAYVKSAQAQAITQLQRLEQAAKERAFGLEQRKAAEAQRHNRATEGAAYGNLTVARERLAFDKSKPAEVKADKPLTEAQAKAATFKSQMEAAEREIDGIALDPTKYLNQVDVALASSAGNILASPEAQRMRQAQEQWAEAFLRFKTGAAATEAEVKRNVKTYFPQQGDKPDVVEQKKRQRAQAVSDLTAAATGRPQSGGATSDSGAVQTATNPKTGEKLMLVNGQWVPAK